MTSPSFILFISIFLLFANIISTTGQNEIRDIQALIDYDKQLELLQQQYTGKLSENVGFSLLYHMREDRWKQGGDWEALFYTDNAIEHLQAHNQSENSNHKLGSILQDETFDNITSNTLQILNDSLPIITRIELFGALKVHKIRLLTILGRYALAQKFSTNLSLEHIEIYGHDGQLLHLQQKLQDLDISNEEVLDLLKRMKYLIDFRALLYFISGQAWLSSGDAFTSVKWFEKAIRLNPCLHQAYYQLSQAVAASPHNNPRNRNDEKSLLIDENSIDRNDASRHQYLHSLANKLENLLYLIHLDPITQQVVLLRHQQVSDNKNALTLLTYFASFFPFLSSSTSSISGDHGKELPVNRNIHCVFGDELQYFHTLLQYSQVSNKLDEGVDDAEVDMDDVLDHSNFKITLNADHPAAFAQQPSSTANQQTTQSSSQPLPHVSRDYVQVVQAALYWSLFTITDALAQFNSDDTTETLSLAFFYLQQARALERFRAHHPLYALYSAEDSQRQAAHILRVFTADYYPRPVYPETMPMTAKEKAFFRDTVGVSAAFHKDTTEVERPIFAHDLIDYWQNTTLQSQVNVEEKEEEDDDRFYGSSIQRPVFIVGFFRSGSTLLETLLTQQDPRIWGLGEHSAFATQMHRMQEDMMRLAEKFEAQRRQYTSRAGRVVDDDLRQLQETMFREILREHAHVIDDLMVSRCTQYVRKRHQPQLTQTAAAISSVIPSQCTRIVDKMLLNYRNIGLIHLLFPQATILHTMRDPVDTMWSCMTHRFGDEAAFTLDVRLLVAEYLLYLSVMQHFRRTLPPRPPVWGLSSGTTNHTAAAAAGDATQRNKQNHQDTNTKAVTNNKNKNKNKKRMVSWDNLALCDTADTTKRHVQDTFPLLCHQQRQLDRQQATFSHAAKVPLRPLIDVRYDTVVTRSSPLLRELHYLLQLPQTNRTFHSENPQQRDTCQQENQKQDQDTDAAGGDTEDESAPIRTASFLQVRRPVNTAAQGKWRRYAPWLKYNLLPLWQDTLYSFSSHPMYELLRTAQDQHTSDMHQKKETQQRKQQQRKKKRNAWRDLVPFSTDEDSSDSSEGPTLPAMNWLGDVHYPYADRLTALAEAVDRACSAS